MLQVPPRRTLARRARVIADRTRDSFRKLLGRVGLVDVSLPQWWSEVSPDFARRCAYVGIPDWELSGEALEMRDRYVAQFDAESVDRRMPEENWKRADICWRRMPKAGSVLDIGSGLGEF